MEQVVTVVVRPHAVAHQDEDNAVPVERGEVASERGVGGAVHVEDRISETRADVGIMAWMRGVVDAPELVAYAMRFAVADDEQVPGLVTQQALGKTLFGLDAFVARSSKALGVAVPDERVATRHRVRTELREDLVVEPIGDGPERNDAIVRAPLDRLQPVDVSIQH